MNQTVNSAIGMQSKEIFLEFYDMNLTFLSILSSFGLILSQYRWHQHQNQEGAKYRQFSFLHFETLRDQFVLEYDVHPDKNGASGTGMTQTQAMEFSVFYPQGTGGASTGTIVLSSTTPSWFTFE